MKEIQREELQELQMQILDCVDAFCKENEICYSIACGTLLGAVRHGGYIPWDDDIDIYMLREDYNKFEKSFPDNCNGRYRFITYSKNKQWHLPFGKVEDCRTVIINDLVKTIPYGVNIDVFVVDDVPDDEMRWLKYRKKQLKMIRRNLLRSYRISEIHSFTLFLKILFCYFYCALSRNSNINQITQYISSNNGKGYTWCFEACQGLHVNHPFSKKCFDDIIDWHFEDRLYKGFRNADDYLENTFGDYMTLPPVEKRISHHRVKAFWK